jgi:hypothetical protein
MKLFRATVLPLPVAEGDGFVVVVDADGERVPDAAGRGLGVGERGGDGRDAVEAVAFSEDRDGAALADRVDLEDDLAVEEALDLVEARLEFPVALGAPEF